MEKVFNTYEILSAVKCGHSIAEKLLVEEISIEEIVYKRDWAQII